MTTSVWMLLLTRLGRSPAVALRSAALALAGVAVVSWTVESWFVDSDDLRYLFTILLVFYGLIVWTALCVLVVSTRRWCRTNAQASILVQGAVVATAATCSIAGLSLLLTAVV